MPEISRFLGIVITMYYSDHARPHFHARYGEYRMSIAIEDGEVLAGEFPRRARSLVREWAALHREELMADWRLAREHRALNSIKPLE